MILSELSSYYFLFNHPLELNIIFRNVENKKVEALMKLQTLAISIMNHIINLDNNL